MRIVVFLLLIGSFSNGQDAPNLFEYGYGGFAEGSVRVGPLLLPPLIKIDQMGFATIVQKGKVMCGTIPQKPLEKFKKSLEKNELLSRDQLLHLKKGANAGIHHGGMSYIRYLDNDDEIIVGAYRIPESGPMRQIIKKARRLKLVGKRVFDPPWVQVDIRASPAFGKEIDWPFEDNPVGSLPERITDSIIISFLMSHPTSSSSMWLEVRVKDKNKTQNIIFADVPYWQPGKNVNFRLGALAFEDQKPEIMRRKAEQAQAQKRSAAFDTLSEQLATQLEGFELTERFDEIDYRHIGYHDQLKRLWILMKRDRNQSTVDSVQWANPISDQEPVFSWVDLFAVLDKIESVAARHTWLRDWKKSLHSRRISLRVVGDTPYDPLVAKKSGDSKVDLEREIGTVWRHSGMQRLPICELVLFEGHAFVGTVYLSDSDSALITSYGNRYSQRPRQDSSGEEGETHWLDQFSISYHKSQNVPEYIMVKANGAWWLNTHPSDLPHVERQNQNEQD